MAAQFESGLTLGLAHRLHWVPALVFMAAIWTLSSLPGTQVSAAIEPLSRSYPPPSVTVPTLHPRQLILEWSKVGHVIGYVGLGGALLFALRRQRAKSKKPDPAAAPAAGDRSRWVAPGKALLLAAAYAVSDELHQSFVPGRSASPMDMALDTTAALAGILLLALVWTLVPRRLIPPA